jgi:hypothetical protein
MALGADVVVFAVSVKVALNSYKVTPMTSMTITDGTDEATRCSRVRRKRALSRVVWLCHPEAVVSMDHQRAPVRSFLLSRSTLGGRGASLMVPESIFTAFEQLKVS